MTVKRAFDLVASLAGLLVLAPLLAAIALAVLVADGRPVFFRQTRMGRYGRAFRIWKFRTMRNDSRGRQLTVGDDPRITRIGAYLRRARLDELPQLINVLVGDMSLVGPRPEVPRYVRRYTPAQIAVLRVRPGITDPASIAYRHEAALLARSADPEATYLGEVMPAKLRMNIEYAERATFWSDLWVIARTLLVVVAPGREQWGAREAPAPASTITSGAG